ncbi:hypothetical protein [Brevibacterium aurantiacum]|uniref:Lipoprotein n=1 Tax=Brevibacterium aurantiacum TaxID=273384 RepID=A0A2A3YZR7_BREAU|nr:hypothetical protein [Brevibacterium aurantiacum]PCC44758.1 hypothetical protein CIK65_00925 [Brevibacterium aurantiacum]
MKLKLALPAVCLTAILTGCGSTATTVVETPKATTSAIDSKLEETLKSTQDWNPLDSSDYDLPNKATDHFNESQVNSVAEDVIGLLENQLKFQQAGSRDEVLDDVDKFIASAPGRISHDLKGSKKASMEGDDELWPVAYVQEVGSAYTIKDESRTTYAWRVREKNMFGTKGVEVLVLHRTFYRLTNESDDENFVSVGRWIGLSTIDPEYAESSKDYAYTINYAYAGANLCDAHSSYLLVPTDKEEDEAFSGKLTSVPSKEFVPHSDFKVNEEAREQALQRC